MPPIAVAVVWIAVILAVTAGFFFVVRKWAGKTGQDRPRASEMLSEFRELHSRGGLSDFEYRRIKASLAPQVRMEAEGAASAGVMSEATAALREGASMFVPVVAPEDEERKEEGGSAGESNRSEAAEDAAGEGCDRPPTGGGEMLA